MSDFQMPNIPDDEVTPGMPDLKWASQMIFIMLGIGIFTYVLFSGFSQLFIAKLSIEDEKKYFGSFYIDTLDEKFDFSKLSFQVEVPKNIDVYLKKSAEVNAFASLGGNIIFTTGLLEKLQYEEELVFILGHEMEHIHSRDPLRAFSTQLPFYITLSFLGVDTNMDYSKIFDITSSYISRKTEMKADNGGIKFLKNIGGNPYCILPFFEDKNNVFTQYLYFNSTHPTNLDRIENITTQSISKQTDFQGCHKIKK